MWEKIKKVLTTVAITFTSICTFLFFRDRVDRRRNRNNLSDNSELERAYNGLRTEADECRTEIAECRTEVTECRELCGDIREDLDTAEGILRRAVERSRKEN